jgi:hypothetical protein
MIYLLSRTDACGYDEYDAKVVRASNEGEARRIANEHVGDEGRIWTNKDLVTCERIEPRGTSDVILASFNAG